MANAQPRPDGKIDDFYLTHITQSPIEIGELMQIFRDHNVTRYLEVGSRWGGSIWKIANEALPVGSRIVSIDSGGGMGGGKLGAKESLPKCIEKLCEMGYDAHLIWADSRDPKTVEQARKLGPYDAILLDGDHSLAGVTADWVNYHVMAPMIALHDVGWISPDIKATTRYFSKVEVPQLWAKLKGKYPKHKFIWDQAYNMGIGVIWR